MSAFSVLEAVAAQDGSPLCWPERNGGLTSALETGRRRFHPAPVTPPLSSSALALVLAGAATLRLIPEIFLPVELLLPCGEHKICPAVHALKYPILKFGHGANPWLKAVSVKTARLRKIVKEEGEALPGASPLWFIWLFRFPAALLPVPFTGESGFHTLFLTWLQIEGMALDLFNDVFLLYLPLKATKGIFKSFALLQSYFCQ